MEKSKIICQLSAIVITKNEESNIGECVACLSFCDEIIVVDSGSTDQTVEIARDSGATVFHNDWPGYGPQKNYALSLTSGQWVLSLDADERISTELAREIRSNIDMVEVRGFEIPRKSTFCGRVIRHSGMWPDFVLRLFRRDAGRFTDDMVHERVVVDGQVGRLVAPINHLCRDGLEDVLDRVDRYSTLAAEQLHLSGRRIRFRSGLAHGFWAFFRTYVLQLGLLDGREGLLIAVAAAEGSFYKYMKAWLRQRNAQSLVLPNSKSTST